ncbi:hypothetical protein FZEAL_7969 [Fusarium zealandicum]|uniref:Zn(2)-C6 fungal-type domain-containing protein n=1 Tax=Fusarium zealandicum TaxID=1053134 RepID=A0A8H4UET0_9HYPO|nr:hypothetical protein FZEAL_7969 [Fusarium zealandicum]
MESTQSVRFAKKSASRKRAAKACLKCRSRKVRCDVTRTKQPCTNCRLDDDECVVAPRGSSVQLLHVERPPALAFRPHGSLHDDLPGAFDEMSQVTVPSWRTPPSSSRHHDRDLSPQSTTDAVLSEKDQCYNHLETASPLNSYGEDADMLAFIQAVEEEACAEDTAPRPPLRSQLKALYSSMPFLKAPDIRDCDLSHLQAQGCLQLPSKTILDEFIRHYFLYVHPMLPLLNEADFWKSYEATLPDAGLECGGSPVSLFLLQAMMFASCTFVTKESLQVLGFPDIHQAKESFYTKAKMLYEFNTDPDPVSIAQAALLLTYWCPTFRPGPRKPNSKWLRIAVNHCKTCKADKYATTHQDRDITAQDLKKQNVLKRVWWCCIIRDRIMPICVRRKIQITRAEFDFDSHPPLGFDDLLDDLESSRVYSVATKHTLLVTLERLTELCASLTDVLGLVYPTENVPVLDAQANSTAFAKVQDHRRVLQQWAEDTHPPLAHQDLSHGTGASQNSTVLFTNLVWIYYHAARVALYNYELHLAIILGLATQELTSSIETHFLENNRKDLRSASKSITDCLSRLLRLRLARWLPSSAVACSALPLALHMLDVKLSSDSEPQVRTHPGIVAKQSRLNVLIQAMKELHPKYDGVDSISQTIRYFMERTNLAESASASTSLVKGRADILARSPTYYLRLALTIDLSLSQDRLPEESDFPTRLRPLLAGTRYSSPTLLRQLNIFQRDGSVKLDPHRLRQRKSPAPSCQTISQWTSDDRSVHFALEMGIVVDEWAAANVCQDEAVADTSPLTDKDNCWERTEDETHESSSFVREFEDLGHLTQWDSNDQPVYFA